MSTPMCHRCQIFLYDFLQIGLHKDIEVTKQIRAKSLLTVLPEFVGWFARVHARIEKQTFRTAHETSLRIARRGRKTHEYEFLIHTATYNFLKFSLPWIDYETEYIKSILIDAGCIKGKDYRKVLKYAQDYLAFIVGRGLYCLHELHDDHINPKGLFTDVNSKFQPRLKQEDEDTCYDKDDYQKEILEEDTENLYF